MQDAAATRLALFDVDQLPVADRLQVALGEYWRPFCRRVFVEPNPADLQLAIVVVRIGDQLQGTLLAACAPCVLDQGGERLPDLARFASQVVLQQPSIVANREERARSDHDQCSGHPERHDLGGQFHDISIVRRGGRFWR